MSLNKDILKKLKAYYSGKMSESEKHLLEAEALEDPFLKEAMDGYESNPGSFDMFQKKYGKSSGLFKNTAQISVTIIGCLVIIWGIVYVFDQNKTPSTSDPIVLEESLDSISTEVEVLPDSIMEMTLAEEIDLVQPKELIQYNDKNVISTNEIIPDEPTESVNNEFIKVEEFEDTSGINFRFVPIELLDFDLKKRAPIDEMFDLYIVDYSKITRDKTEIKYTRYELSGTAANLENDETEGNQDLVEKQVEVPYVEYLHNTMSYFVKENYKKALKRFLVILEQYPNDLNAQFYGGLCYFNLNKYEQSIELFDKVLASEWFSFNEEAKWYKAKALVKLGRTSEAHDVLDEIIISQGFYADKAMELKRKL